VVWDDGRERIWRPTGIRPKVAVWDVQHLAALLEGVRDDPLFSQWWLMVVRGLRCGEVVALRGEDVVLAEREIRIQEQFILINGVSHPQ
jgi:hypothetical protein